MHEEDYGILWKHVDLHGGTHRGAPQSRRLVVSFDRHRRQLRVRLLLVLLPRRHHPARGEAHRASCRPMAIDAGRRARAYANVDRRQGSPRRTTSTCSAPASTSTSTAPSNEVYEVDAERAAGRAGQPVGNAFRPRVDAARDASPRRGATSTPRAAACVEDRRTPTCATGSASRSRYKLVPTMPTPTLLRRPDSSVGRRAGFARAQPLGHAVRPDERRAAGEYPNQHAGGDGLPAWTAADRPLVDTDVVLWYTFGVTHFVRPEDWPVMPVEYAGFLLSPSASSTATRRSTCRRRTLLSANRMPGIRFVALRGFGAGFVRIGAVRACFVTVRTRRRTDGHATRADVASSTAPGGGARVSDAGIADLSRGGFGAGFGVPWVRAWFVTFACRGRPDLAADLLHSRRAQPLPCRRPGRRRPHASLVERRGARRRPGRLPRPHHDDGDVPRLVRPRPARRRVVSPRAHRRDAAGLDDAPAARRPPRLRRRPRHRVGARHAAYSADPAGTWMASGRTAASPGWSATRATRNRRSTSRSSGPRPACPCTACSGSSRRSRSCARRRRATTSWRTRWQPRARRPPLPTRSRSRRCSPTAPARRGRAVRGRRPGRLPALARRRLPRDAGGREAGPRPPAGARDGGRQGDRPAAARALRRRRPRRRARALLRPRPVSGSCTAISSTRWC